MNFDCWAPLKFVDPDLMITVKLAYVFGKDGQEVFLVTDTDDVYACGPNFSNCLGLGENIESQREPAKVHALCKKKIRGFSSSFNRDGAFMCAYTEDEKMYFWGKFLVRSSMHCTPTLFPHTFATKVQNMVFKVQEVVAGPNHCLIVTSDGSILSFGYNEHGQLGRPCCKSYVPTFIDEFRGKFVARASVGAHFSVAVLDDGEVYAWGQNDFGQLGIGNRPKSVTVPNKISALRNVRIKSIVCGEAYVLAISDSDELYSWGNNKHGQLGLGDFLPRYYPTKIETIGKVIDVAATCYASTSAAMSECNVVYAWGVHGRKCEIKFFYHEAQFTRCLLLAACELVRLAESLVASYKLSHLRLHGTDETLS